jgi:hypothetical protein
MKATRYFALAAFAIAVLFMGTRLVNANPQVQPTYGGGGGMIAGSVYGFNMFDELEPIAWASVHANSGPYSFVAYTSGGGFYEMYVPQGTYNVTVIEPGYVPYSSVVAVSPGSASTINFYLEESHVPVPEFPSGMVLAVTVLALAVVLVAAKRTRRRQ